MMQAISSRFFSAPPLDHVLPLPVHLSVSDLPPASSPSFTAELDVTIIDNPEKIILTSQF